MNLQTTTILVALALLLGSCRSLPQAAPQPNVDAASQTVQWTVQFKGIEAITGELVCALYKDAASFDSNSKPMLSAFLPVESEQAEWKLDLAPGVYAIKVYQDLNANRALDRKTFGIPVEPYGFSNDAKVSFGPPSFEAASFEVGPSPKTLSITLR